MMKPYEFLKSAAAVGMLVTLTACAGMSKSESNALIGAAAGGVAGSVLTGGSTIGTIGGAVAGGAIGNEMGKKKR